MQPRQGTISVNEKQNRKEMERISIYIVYRSLQTEKLYVNISISLKKEVILFKLEFTNLENFKHIPYCTISYRISAFIWGQLNDQTSTVKPFYYE